MGSVELCGSVHTGERPMPTLFHIMLCLNLSPSVFCVYLYVGQCERILKASKTLLITLPFDNIENP